MLKKSILVIFLILLCDQILKIWVKTHMYQGQEIHVAGNWFIIHFVENEGMAYGMKFGGNFGKLLLSLFRIVAIGAIGWYILKLVKENANKYLIICMSFIFAGAMGNIIDSAFYGLMFNNNYPHADFIFLKGGGYAPFLHGNVVDMLYFPLFDGSFPTWFPIWGGESFVFFRPVFNIADSSITVGVIILLIFQRKFYGKPREVTPEIVSEEPEINV